MSDFSLNNLQNLSLEQVSQQLNNYNTIFQNSTI